MTTEVISPSEMGRSDRGPKMPAFNLRMDADSNNEGYIIA